MIDYYTTYIMLQTDVHNTSKCCLVILITQFVNFMYDIVAGRLSHNYQRNTTCQKTQLT